MNKFKLFSLTFFSILCFALNSILCKAALLNTKLDPNTFTLFRLGSGALTLWLILILKDKKSNIKDISIKNYIKNNALSGFYLFLYASMFSIAYVKLTSSIGALLLFASVQATMISFGIKNGDKLNFTQSIAYAVSWIGILILFLPSTFSEKPALFASLIMIISGISWGCYSIVGAREKNSFIKTTNNFTVATVISIFFYLFLLNSVSLDLKGLTLAIASGSITSGLGYITWYYVLPSLTYSTAAIIQLSSPVIVSILGTLFLNEEITQRLITSYILVLSGIAVFIFLKNKESNSA